MHTRVRANISRISSLKYLLHCFIETFGDIQDPQNVAVLVQHGLHLAMPVHWEYHMTEPSSNHDLQGLCRGAALTRTNRILCHDIPDENVSRIDSLSDHPKRQVLRRENPTQSLLIINDQHTILPFCSHNL